ncbi:MAG TPA: rhomboid family intramembrane serine protease [Candidatus Sulfotelmatobacter sp.]|jgi:membrane associated rhomboid family serine protease|nr:rhomboid family intramembrane serine protease [Candidatus Sulfotelmatobacter sp.]
MNRGNTISLSLPPFTRWVKRLILVYAGIYLFMAITEVVSPLAHEWVSVYLGLIPKLVMHGMVWQLVTYSFLHFQLLHFIFNALSLWMFGSQLESDWGSKRFLEFYFFCTVAAALTTVAMSYTHILGLSPVTTTIGASGGIYGLLVAFGVLYGESEIMMFPLPFRIKAKYFVWGIVFLTLVGAIQERGGVANFAHLGGLLFGYLYLKFLPRKGLMFSASERYFSARNDYYRWKRRRAAKKFEVYMRQHDRDVHFDEHGNYIPPDDDPGKGNGGSKSGWVN